ncbi:hypothetical protein ACIO1C_22450 [Streptomyces sp. NPDC087420]|uniref:hypothetical protein n=1 Tax=Streptomyces sp. NPDC087420 TaxID=3365785 RepID=UPI0038399112
MNDTYALGAMKPDEPLGPTTWSDAARAAWQRGQAEAASLLRSTPAARSPTDHAEIARTALRSLAKEVKAAADLREVAELTGAFFDLDRGAAGAFTSVVEAVAHHFESRVVEFEDTDPAYVQRHRLAAIAEALTDTTDGLHTTPRAFSLLDPQPPENPDSTTRQKQALAASPSLASHTRTERPVTTPTARDTPTGSSTAPPRQPGRRI